MADKPKTTETIALTQADIDAAVAAKEVELTSANAAAVAAAVAAEARKAEELKTRLAQYEADKLAADQNKSLSEIAELLAKAPEEKRQAIMNAIEAGDAQSLLIQSREQATQPLIQERDTGFATRDTIIAEQQEKLNRFEMVVPCQSALSKHCGGMDNEIMAEMALNQIMKMFTRDADGKIIPDVNGPTKGMHPTEAKPLDFEGAALFMATIPAFQKNSTTSVLQGGAGDKQDTAKTQGSFSERLKNAKTEEDKEAIREEMRQSRRPKAA